MTSLLAVLDSAAMFLALSPKAAPVIPARLCLRSGLLCFNRIARRSASASPMSRPGAGTSLTYEEFLDAGRMREIDFPIEREPGQAWPEFVGWRVNYERAAYAVAAAVCAVPALWSGRGGTLCRPFRPAARDAAALKSAPFRTPVRRSLRLEAVALGVQPR